MRHRFRKRNRILRRPFLKERHLKGSLQQAEEKLRQIGQDLESKSGLRAEEKQHILTLTEQLERLKSSLEQETLRRQESQDQLREALSQQQQLDQDLERLVAETKTLHADLITERRMHETTKKQTQSLEEQVSALNREKIQAEQTAADLKPRSTRPGLPSPTYRKTT